MTEGTSAAMQPGSPHVLVVDDDCDLAESVADFLDLSGIPAVSVTDPTLAMARLRDNPSIAVVVTDLRMPGMDGMELAELIASSDMGGREIRTIMMTAHQDLDIAFAAGRGPVHAFLTKPFDPQKLASIVREVDQRLGGHEAAQDETEEDSAHLPAMVLIAAVAEVVRGAPHMARHITVDANSERHLACEPAAAVRAVVGAARIALRLGGPGQTIALAADDMPAGGGAAAGLALSISSLVPPGDIAGVTDEVARLRSDMGQEIRDISARVTESGGLRITIIADI